MRIISVFIYNRQMCMYSIEKLVIIKIHRVNSIPVQGIGLLCYVFVYEIIK